MMKKIVIVGMLIIILILSISIEKNKNEVSKATSPSYITYGTTAKINNLKLTNSEDRRSKDILVALFEGLVKEDESGKIIPGLAKEYSVSEDNIEYVFKLKDNVFYSNGDKITSQSYKKFLLEFLKDKDNIYAKDLNCIFGVPEYRDGKNDAEAVAINCPDDETLTIRLNYPCNELLNILASPVMGLRDYNNLDSFKNSIKNIRYTGPFSIDSMEKEDIIISKNNKYYDKDNVTNEKIKFISFNTIEEALALFEAPDTARKDEGVDMLLEVPVNEVSRLSKEDKIETFQGSDTYYMVFNNKSSAVNNIYIRNLIENSISKEKYVSEIAKEILSVANSYDTENGTKEVFSPNIKPLDEGSLTTEKEKLKDTALTIIYEKNSLTSQLTQFVEEDIKKAFQVETHFIECSREDLEEKLSHGEYDIALMNFQRRYNYLGEYLQSLGEGSALNYTKYSNQEFNSLLQEARYEKNEEARKLLYDKCEKILREEVVSIPLCSVKYPLCIREDLQGIRVNKTGNIIFNGLKIKK